MQFVGVQSEQQSTQEVHVVSTADARQSGSSPVPAQGVLFQGDLPELDEAGVEMAETEDDEVEKFKEFLDHVSADDFDTEADTDS